MTLAVWCPGLGCDHHGLVDVERYGDDVPVPRFGPRMRCERCGHIGGCPAELAGARRGWGVQELIADLRLSIGHQSVYNATMSRQDIDFSCRHCGAQYVVSYTELSVADSGSVYCKCCKRRMVQWNSALKPRYRLVERPQRQYS